MGVVKHAVNKSAGSKGFIGNCSLAAQAASCIHSLKDGGLADGLERDGAELASDCYNI